MLVNRGRYPEADCWNVWDDAATEWKEVTFGTGLDRLHAAAGTAPRGDTVSTSLNRADGVGVPFGGTKILCVGRNYRPHAAELGNEVPKQPLWFLKPPSSLAPNEGRIRLPTDAGRIDYEGEAALVIGKRCSDVPESGALSCIAGITLALDITARELQKADGQWTRAKGFDTFCPVGPAILPFGEWACDTELVTRLNGAVVQRDRTSSLVFSFAALIAHISRCMTLEPGDLILTGTPAGVGPLAAGDRISVEFPGLMRLGLTVDSR